MISDNDENEKTVLKDIGIPKTVEHQTKLKRVGYIRPFCHLAHRLKSNNGCNKRCS